MVGPLSAGVGLRLARSSAQLIVPDDQDPEPGQLRRGAFLAQLRAETCAAADAALRPVGRSSEGCPQIERWFAVYGNRDAAQLERAARRYAPEAASAGSATEVIDAVVARVRAAIDRWVATGEVTGVPDVASLAVEGVASAVRDTASQAIQGAGATAEAVVSTVSSEVSSAVSSVGSAVSSATTAAADAVAAPLAALGLHLSSRTEASDRPEEDPLAVRAGLGPGEPLEAETRRRMEGAFGRSLADVRVHRGGAAADTADRLSAHALTVGQDVGFARGEYRPGTFAGDALIAHELAHAIQQGAGGSTIAMPDGREAASAEASADRSALGVLTSLWGPQPGGVSRLGVPSLTGRSGLRLARCATATRATTGGTTTPAAASNVPWADAVHAAERETDEGRRNAAMTALVQRALGSRTVRLGGTSHPDDEDPADYIPAPAINFDPRLNTKRRWHSRRSLSTNAGHSFQARVGGVDQWYCILGPRAISADRGEVETRMTADHELFHAAHPSPATREGDSDDPDAEVAAWTDEFVHYFLLTYMRREAWARLIEYYQRAAAPAREASLNAIVAFANGLSTAAASGADGSTRSDRARFEVWLRRRMRDSATASQQLIIDLSTALRISASGATP